MKKYLLLFSILVLSLFCVSCKKSLNLNDIQNIYSNIETSLKEAYINVSIKDTRSNDEFVLNVDTIITKEEEVYNISVSKTSLNAFPNTEKYHTETYTDIQDSPSKYLYHFNISESKFKNYQINVGDENTTLTGVLKDINISSLYDYEDLLLSNDEFSLVIENKLINKIYFTGYYNEYYIITIDQSFSY